jgi:TPR repeat protein
VATLAALADRAVNGGINLTKKELLELAGDSRIGKVLAAQLLFLVEPSEKDFSKWDRACLALSEEAEDGDIVAAHFLAYIYTTGPESPCSNRSISISENLHSPQSGLQWAEFAALSGHIHALMALGYLFTAGEAGTTPAGFAVTPQRDCEKALVLYKEAARLTMLHFTDPMSGLWQDDIPDLPALGAGDLLHDGIVGQVKRRAARSARISKALKYRAAQGDADALLQVGHMIQRDDGRSGDDLALAASYLSAALERGNTRAAGALGWQYVLGQGVPVNTTRANELLLTAVPHDPAACVALAALRSTQGGEDDDHTLLDCGLAAELPAAHHYAALRLSESGRHSASVQHLMVASEEHYLPSTYAAAQAFEFGRGTGQRSCNDAVSLYRRVAESGQVTQRLRQGINAYVKGEFHVALQAFARGAHEGVAVAQYNAAWMMNRGLGIRDFNSHSIEKCRVRARELLTSACDAGLVHAHVELAKMMYSGEGGAQNRKLAADHMGIAAAGGHAEATFHLARWYEAGIGVSEDLSKSEELYRSLLAMRASDTNWGQWPLQSVFTEHVWLRLRLVRVRLKNWIFQSIPRGRRGKRKKATPEKG